MPVGDRVVDGVDADLIEQFNALRTAYTALAASYTLTLAKIDADSGDTGGDSDYAALNPAPVDASLDLVTGEGIPGKTAPEAPVIPENIGDGAV